MNPPFTRVHFLCCFCLLVPHCIALHGLDSSSSLSVQLKRGDINIEKKRIRRKKKIIFQDSIKGNKRIVAGPRKRNRVKIKVFSFLLTPFSLNKNEARKEGRERARGPVLVFDFSFFLCILALSVWRPKVSSRSKDGPAYPTSCNQGKHKDNQSKSFSTVHHQPNKIQRGRGQSVHRPKDNEDKLQRSPVCLPADVGAGV